METDGYNDQSFNYFEPILFPKVAGSKIKKKSTLDTSRLHSKAICHLQRRLILVRKNTDLQFPMNSVQPCLSEWPRNF